MAANVFLPQKLRVNVVVIISERNAYSEDTLWDKVEDFGEHGIDGLYTCVTLKYMGRLWKVETSAREDELLIRGTPLMRIGKEYIALGISNI